MFQGTNLVFLLGYFAGIFVSVIFQLLPGQFILAILLSVPVYMGMQYLAERTEK